MKILFFILRCIRQIGKRIYKNGPKFYKNINVHYTGQEASDIIYSFLKQENPCMIARFGYTELRCIVNYLRLTKPNFRNYLEYIKGKDIRFCWEDSVKKEMMRLSGLFPASEENLERFSQLMLKCVPNVDILGSWLPEEIYVKDKLTNAIMVNLSDLEPFNHNNPWTRALKGKNVLVIHPFTESIKNQYLKRDKLFNNKDILPDFNLDTIKAVQSIAYNDCEYKNWFEALEAMKLQIQQKQFDIAIIGCGAYGFPLASFIKDQGKKAVHLGGVTQILFGIKGGRWDTHEAGLKLYNEYWIRPSKEETPVNNKKVEDGCYW
jgi:hypothetical protein